MTSATAICICVHARKRAIFGLKLISRVIYHKDNFRRVFFIYLPFLRLRQTLSKEMYIYTLFTAYCFIYENTYLVNI